MTRFAVPLGILHVIGCGFAAFVLFFVATFPWENQTSEGEIVLDVVAILGAAGFVLSLAVLGAVVARPRWAVVAFGAHVAIALPTLAFMVFEAGSNAPVRVAAIALAIEAAGFVAALTAARDAR